MCVIYANYTSVPSLKELQQGEERNEDGAGVAWVEKGEVFWEKGLTAKEIWEVLKKIPFPNVVHFRNATIGPPIPELSHPFPLTPKVPLFLRGQTSAGVLVHNGSLHDWKKLASEACLKSGRKLPGGEWSDSRALAWLVANFGEGILTARESDLVFGQRIAVLTADGRLTRWGSSWPKDPEKGTGYFQSWPTFSSKGKTKTSGSVYQYGSGVDWQKSPVGGVYTPSTALVQSQLPPAPPIATKVHALGSGAGYFFDPSHERRLEPLRHPDAGLVAKPEVPPPTKVTVIKGFGKQPEAAQPTPSQVLYTKGEMEKVLAAVSARQSELAAEKHNIITFPRKTTSH